jgi:hypothetical protein
VLADGLVTGSFEQSVRYDGVERPELPMAEEVGSTAWYRQLKVPVVRCQFTVHEATALDLPDDYDDHPIFGIEWDRAARRLSFDGNGATVTCGQPNLEITATDFVARYVRLRQWRLGGLETGGRWPDD